MGHKNHVFNIELKLNLQDLRLISKKTKKGKKLTLFS